MILVFLLGGLIAGSIDSIVGGGGLITLPILTFATEGGAYAVGTNKIVGTLGALIALIVYAKKGHLDIKSGLFFVLCVGGGSFVGSRISPLLPPQSFKIILFIMVPLLLFLLSKKDAWTKRSNEVEVTPTHLGFITLSGVLSGLYDGMVGPGGGTFMFLSLFWVAKFELLAAIAISKLANTASASVSLASYYHQGFVHVKQGLLMGAGMSVGSFIGAFYGGPRIEKIVRPMLFVISILLVITLLFFKK